ncbi:macro domain-containing protein [Arthrobacter halodurans]|uniref:Macro domain-containing protein n=1 Tax=Arthrobacter halodurans TaxID=516699 RepID=A0ABV4UN78_9MICC
MRVAVLRGDIAAQEADAIVNAANSALSDGAGVNGALHAAAGPALAAACRELRRRDLPRGLPVGSAVATAAGRLAARWVIHTVGPNRHAGETDPALLASCFTSSLSVAAGLGARSVAFPAIGAGIFGWDAAEVADVAAGALARWSATDAAGSIDEVRFVLFGPEAEAEFRRAFAPRD